MDERIRTMRQVQISNALADYQRHLVELEAATDKADIVADPVAFGVLAVEKEG